MPVLNGEKAIEALYDFIGEVDEQRGKELTEKQTNALTKLAKGLILSIETERHPFASIRDIKEASKETLREMLAVKKLERKIEAKREAVKHLDSKKTDLEIRVEAAISRKSMPAFSLCRLR